MKTLLSIVICLISLQGYNQTHNSSEANNYFVSAAEKVDSGNYAGAISDLAKISSIDSAYIKANFHWAEKIQSEVKIAWTKYTITPYHKLVISAVHPKSEVSRLRKDSKMLNKEYKKALEVYEKTWKLNPAGRELQPLNDKLTELSNRYQESTRKIRYFKGNIILDTSLAGFKNLEGLFYTHWNKLFDNKYFVVYSDNIRTGTRPTKESEEQGDYTDILRTLDITLNGKEFREALMSDNKLALGQQKDHK
jgi:tetratricopeptide (TPR) repeat protein